VYRNPPRLRASARYFRKLRNALRELAIIVMRMVRLRMARMSARVSARRCIRRSENRPCFSRLLLPG
jgi:hypothetical protein